ncbi:transaldolase family protein [Streptomyces tremellae]|uniref:Transaldolase n=1 Tax=Streptomyces tremellae TaxID=1124239 RepID=A0ABP7FUW9_9ACTN
MTTWSHAGSSRALDQLTAEGVGLWLDDYHRGRLVDGSLERMVAAGLVRGVVSRPAAVARAITSTAVYRKQLNGFSGAAVSAEERAYALIAEDAREAGSVLEPVFRATAGMHGWVSLGIAPRPDADARAMVDHSRRLARMVDRPNVLIRIPAVGRGLTAAGHLLAQQVNVHFTAVFSTHRYAQAADTYFRGLERALTVGRAPSAVTSLVSLDTGRLTDRVDKLLDRSAVPGAAGLRGRAGAAVARLVYHRYEESLGTSRWRSLVAGGARPQRLLWTGSDPRERPRAALDRVEGLVAWMTLHALPQTALEALERREPFRGDMLSGARESACRTMDALGRAGVDVDALARDLESAAAARERTAWQALLRAAEVR